MDTTTISMALRRDIGFQDIPLSMSEGGNGERHRIMMGRRFQKQSKVFPKKRKEMKGRSLGARLLKGPSQYSNVEPTCMVIEPHIVQTDVYNARTVNKEIDKE